MAPASFPRIIVANTNNIRKARAAAQYFLTATLSRRSSLYTEGRIISSHATLNIIRDNTLAVIVAATGRLIAPMPIYGLHA